MTDSGGGCCRCCCSFIFTLGLTALFMWLSLRTSNPSCSIDKFYLPALNKSSNYSQNTSIFFDVKLKNDNKDKGIYYDAVNLSFYYIKNTTRFFGNFTVVKFYQGHKKTAFKHGIVKASGDEWEAVFQEVSNGTPVVFGVDLATAVRFKIMAWKTKRHKIMVKGNVTVNNQGIKESKKVGKLKSGALKRGSSYRALLGLLVIFSLLILDFGFWI
ncbi:hypothetical protein L1049_000468 [Liquidambar formosana]|uniref:Late embryogenesis abundant protein LEA-2 subgroup domain-containing protein n=1 Tax=Liquidambar formosana TaxID=63359 RepID=A0AAP0R2X8_LIQFO